MWNNITNASTVASLLGFSISSIFADAFQSHLLTAAGVISMSFLTWKGYSALDAVIHRKFPNGYEPIATFMRYSTSDGKNGVYEIFRHIQVKKPLMKSFPHGFYWTGSKPPKISSSLQIVGAVTQKSTDNGHSVDLKFSNPCCYNASEIVHIQMHVDDSDEKSNPCIGLNITDPMQLIHFRSELLHSKSQNYSQKAYVERRSLSANAAAPFETILAVSMDPSTRAYEHIIPRPEPGFHYRLRWDRIPQTKAARRKNTP